MTLEQDITEKEKHIKYLKGRIRQIRDTQLQPLKEALYEAQEQLRRLEDQIDTTDVTDEEMTQKYQNKDNKQK